MAISMVFTGVWTVAMPLVAEFQFNREIEDRLTGADRNLVAGHREAWSLMK